MNKVDVSIIIVNYNGKKWLERLLPTLNKQKYTSYEIIIVDNGSVDESIEYVEKNFKKIKLIKLKTNLGFSDGNNIGFKYSLGDKIILLNNDTEVDTDYISSFVRVFDEIPQCSIAQSKIVYLSNPEKIDSCGSYMTSTSFQYYIGNNKDSQLKIYNIPFKVFSTKGASMIIKRNVIEKIGLFDKNYWSYYEETDFCHRAWVCGFETWYWPNAIIKHSVGGTSTKMHNDFIQFHNYKNKLSSLIKCLSLNRLLYMIPIYILITLLIMLFWAIQRRWKCSLAIIRSIWWNIININITLHDRKNVQSNRLQSDSEIFSKVLRNPKPIYYYYLFSNTLEKYEEK